MLFIACLNVVTLQTHERWWSMLRTLGVTAGMLLLAVIGYFFFGVVVAIHAGLWLHDEKMYFAQGWPAQVFGAVGAILGVGLGWGIGRLTRRRNPEKNK
jgi:membrane protein DedA with SNARE-associated domain